MKMICLAFVLALVSCSNESSNSSPLFQSEEKFKKVSILTRARRMAAARAAAEAHVSKIDWLRRLGVEKYMEMYREGDRDALKTKPNSPISSSWRSFPTGAHSTAYWDGKFEARIDQGVTQDSRYYHSISRGVPLSFDPQ